MASRTGSAVTAAADLGARVRAARKELGLSQAQLAGDELTKGFISQLEAGTVRPSVRSLQIIASRLNRPLEYFLGDESLDTEKRVAFHRLAAEAAAEQRDWDAVRAHTADGLAAVADRAERARLLYLLARAEDAARERERAFELIGDALGLIEVASEPQLVAALLFLRGSMYAEMGQLVAASESLEASRDVIERYEVLDPRLRSRVMVSLGTTYRRLRRSSRALSAYESALATASRASELALAARGYMGIAATHYDAGDLDSAIASYRRALELFQRVSDIDFELNALQSIATVQFENGEADAAKGSAQRAMRRAIEVGNARWAAVVEVTLSRIALKEGRAEEALRMAAHAVDVLEASSDAVNRADALGACGAAHEALGHRADADRAYRASIDHYTEIGDLADRSGMAAEYARVLRARGEVDAAFEMLELARSGSPREG